MNVANLLNKMFPGDMNTGIPSFSELDLNVEKNFRMADMRLITTELETCSDEVDVNETLKELKAVNFEQVQRFIGQALELYFTHPKVVAVLQQGYTPLYPHVRSLDDINYDLLAPVLEKNLGGFDE